MAVLQKGKSNYPFWGASINLITGLDPLSLQTTSEATYSALLPGITNLTNRMRYYGFYCWLLDFYFKQETKGNSTEQYKFIRRAELMVAILMQSEKKDIQQVTGSNFASTMIQQLTGGSYDLAWGADRDGTDKEVYWKYPSGAFGQYYYGAMRAISLVVAAVNDDKDVIFNITQPNKHQRVSGQALAEAFDESLSLEAKALFYQNITQGKLNVADIQKLIPYFSIDRVNTDSREWELYVAMILDKDEPGFELEDQSTFHRKETIFELIQTANENGGEYDWYQLLLKSYQKKLGSAENPVSDTLKGWYAYQFNEYYQYACGAILWAVLQHLYQLQQDQYLPTLVRDMSKSITEVLCQSLDSVNPNSTVQEVIAALPAALDEESLYHSIEAKAASDPYEAAKQGFLLLFRLYRENIDMLHPLKEFLSRKKMLREGNMLEGLLSFPTAEKDNIGFFIEQFLLRSIIYRHQMVAMRKMGNGTQSTHKFILEDQSVRFIATYPPRSTSPRMNALRNLLYDLGIVDENGKTTPLYPKLLSA